jgi:hypothetical protein
MTTYILPFRVELIIRTGALANLILNASLLLVEDRYINSVGICPIKVPVGSEVRNIDNTDTCIAGDNICMR